METVFIAVQCFKCSTMQVTAEESSNKWTCVSATRKLSIRKVFSQAFMAKDVQAANMTSHDSDDVRLGVSASSFSAECSQVGFNMSRQFVEQEQELLLGDENEKENEEVEVERRSAKKRNDWSEYIYHDVYNHNDNDNDQVGPDVRLGVSELDTRAVNIFSSFSSTAEWIAPYSSVVLLPCLELPSIWDLCEPNVVTELPKPLFKKPKLRDNYSAAGLDCEDGAKLRRLVFGKRNVKKKVDNLCGYKFNTDYFYNVTHGTMDNRERKFSKGVVILNLTMDYADKER
ncbi:MRN complex-interacting protein [Tanacetum coccineum]